MISIDIGFFAKNPHRQCQHDDIQSVEQICKTAASSLLCSLYKLGATLQWRNTTARPWKSQWQVLLAFKRNLEYFRLYFWLISSHLNKFHSQFAVSHLAIFWLVSRRLRYFGIDSTHCRVYSLSLSLKWQQIHIRAEFSWHWLSGLLAFVLE